MYKKEMVSKIAQAHAEFDMMKPNGYDYDELATHLLKRITDAGMRAGSVPGDKVQFLYGKYIDPNINIWEDDFDTEHGKEFNSRYGD